MSSLSRIPKGDCSRLYIALNAASNDRDRFEHWFFNNIGGSCEAVECINFPGGCWLSEEDFACGNCIRQASPCSWQDAFHIAVIQGELNLSYGKAFEYFSELLKDPHVVHLLRRDESRDPDPDGDQHPVKIQARLHEVQQELEEVRKDIERRDKKLKKLNDDLDFTKRRLADTRRELAAYASRNPPRMVETAPAGSTNPSLHRSSRPYTPATHRSLAMYRKDYQERFTQDFASEES